MRFFNVVPKMIMKIILWSCFGDLLGSNSLREMIMDVFMLGRSTSFVPSGRCQRRLGFGE